VGIAGGGGGVGGSGVAVGGRGVAVGARRNLSRSDLTAQGVSKTLASTLGGVTISGKDTASFSVIATNNTAIAIANPFKHICIRT
jgi:hypothetical protein